VAYRYGRRYLELAENPDAPPSPMLARLVQDKWDFVCKFTAKDLRNLIKLPITETIFLSPATIERVNVARAKREKKMQKKKRKKTK
jgi:hypothetical protein